MTPHSFGFASQCRLRLVIITQTNVISNHSQRVGRPRADRFRIWEVLRQTIISGPCGSCLVFESQAAAHGLQPDHPSDSRHDDLRLQWSELSPPDKQGPRELIGKSISHQSDWSECVFPLLLTSRACGRGRIAAALNRKGSIRRTFFPSTG